MEQQKELMQKTFNKVSEHLLKQNQKSYKDGEGCFYRAKIEDKILMCAVGCLIPDEKYYSSIENRKASDSRVINLISDEYYKRDGEFLDGLQRIHDKHEVSQWRKELKEFAQYYELNCDL